MTRDSLNRTSLALNRDAKDRAFATITAIGADLLEDTAAGVSDEVVTERTKRDLFSGLFPAYGDAAEEIENGLDACSRIVDGCLDRAERQRRISLFGGWAGLGWITAHLEAEDDSVGTYVDRLLLQTLGAWPSQYGYDLISGLVGVGVYFLQRLPAKSGEQGLRLVLAALEDASIHVGGGTTWFTAPELLPPWQRDHAPNGYFNLGVAHGVPGVCWLLAKLCAAGVATDRAGLLLRRSLRWLVSTQRDPANAELPSWIAPGIDRETNRRLAWCYGPLGASAVVLEAAKAIGDREAIDWARALALACAAVPPEDGRIADAGLCHGAAGNAQIFYRLARNNDDSRFREAAEAWFQATLEYRIPGTGVGGYRMWGDVGNNRQAWLDDASFLTGSAGVGLALMTRIADIEPGWDRLLLLS